MFFWEVYYSRLFNEAMERATKTSKRSPSNSASGRAQCGGSIVDGRKFSVQAHGPDLSSRAGYLNWNYVRFLQRSAFF
jgi:hypothetical protein